MDPCFTKALDSDTGNCARVIFTASIHLYDVFRNGCASESSSSRPLDAGQAPRFHGKIWHGKTPSRLLNTRGHGVCLLRVLVVFVCEDAWDASILAHGVGMSYPPDYRFPVSQCYQDIQIPTRPCVEQATALEAANDLYNR